MVFRSVVFAVKGGLAARIDGPVAASLFVRDPGANDCTIKSKSWKLDEIVKLNETQRQKGIARVRTVERCTDLETDLSGGDVSTPHDRLGNHLRSSASKPTGLQLTLVTTPIRPHAAGTRWDPA